jgi:hypothetical protein
MVSRFGRLAAILISMTILPSAMAHHYGRVLLMGKWVLIFDDKRILFNAGMLSGDFFDLLERRKTTEGEFFFINSRRVIDYPGSVTVKLFGSPWELGDTVFDKRCPGNAAALMSSLQFKAEWKTGLSMRPVSKMTVRSLQKQEMMPYPSLWGYELAISSEGVPLTDHLIVNVYGPDSNLVVRFSAKPI